MNALPAELRTPPLPLVAFVGCPELWGEVGAHFHRTLRPPFYSVGVAEPTEPLLARLFGSKPPLQPKPFRTPDGILKADWFQKQRQRRAAVALAFVPRSHIDGDPSSWMRMLALLRTIRAASSHKAIWLLLVVVQDGPPRELPPDRLAGLVSNLDLEPRHVCVISRQLFDASLPQEQRFAAQDEQLRPLGALVAEAAGAHYSAAAARLRQKQLDLSAALGSCPPEVSAAIAFKLAVLAEFRQDWLAAVASYQAAAAALQGVPLGRPTVSCQRHAEVTAVAEVVHFKAMMLLLHQQRYPEAAQQLASHLAAFGPLPEGLPLPAAAAHYGWLSRQYQVAAEMIAGSRMDLAAQANRQVAPCHLLMSAAQLALARKAAVEQLSQLRGGAPPPFDAAAVRRGRYLGQFELKQPDGAPLAPQAHSADLSDAQFCLFLEAEQRRVNHSHVVMELLAAAQAAHLRQAAAQAAATASPALPALIPVPTGVPVAPPAAAARAGSRAATDRVAARLALLIAEQHIDTHNLTAARKLLLQVAHTYRRDGWDALLLHCLLQQREVCQRLKLHKESLLHSLEVACLADHLAPGAGGSSTGGAPGGMLDQQQAAALASAALLGLLAGPLENKSSMRKPQPLPQQEQQLAGIGEAPPAQQQPQEQQQQQQQQQDQQAGSASSTATPPGAAAAAAAVAAAGASRWDYVVQHLDLTSTLQQAPLAQAAGKDEAAAKSAAIADILLQHRQQDFGWWRVLTVAGGFVAHAPDPTQLCVGVALCSNLPAALPLEGATLSVADSHGSWRQPLQPGPPPLASSGDDGSAAYGAVQQPGAAALAARLGELQLSGEQQQAPGAAAWPLQLQAGRWQLLHATFAPRCVGSTACEELELHLSPQVSVAFRLTSFPTGRPALGLSSLPLGAREPFALRQRVRLGAWTAKVQHVGPLPQLQVLQPQLLLVGELAPLEVRVRVVAPQPSATLELSVRSGTGAAPGGLTLLAAQPDGKLQELNPESQVLPLPSLDAGACWVQRLWVRAQLPIECRLHALLSCPASVAASGALVFREPFEHRARLCGEPASHALVAASPAYAAVNGGAAEAQAAAAAAAAAGAAAGPGAAAGAVPLVVGQSVFVQLLVGTGALHAVELLLLDAELELRQGSELQLLNQLGDQLGGKPLTLGLGSVHCLLLQLVALAKTKAPGALGHVKLTWRRRHPAAVVDSDGGGGAAGAALPPPCAPGALPAAEVVTRLELPAVLVQDSLLTVRVVAPQSATAGISFPFTLQMHNQTPQPQEVQLVVQEAAGFVFSGAKQQLLTLAPRATHDATWTLVAHASGQLPLPAVRVAATRLACHTVTQGSSVHVMPF